MTYADVLGMKVARCAAVGVEGYAILQPWCHFQTRMQDKRTTRLYQRCIMVETLQISLLGAIDVEMVRVGRGDDAHPGAQPMEASVKFIGLNHHIIAVLAQDIVGIVVLRDTSEKGIAIHAALVHDMCAHGGCGGLAMGTCHTKSLVCMCQPTEHLGTFLHGKAMLTEIHQFMMFSWYCRGIDHQRGLGIATCAGYIIYIVLVMQQHALPLQLGSQG